MIAMKILIVYTEMTETEQTHEAIDAMVRLLADSELETEIVRLSSEHFEPCVVCGKCYKKHRCIFEDEVNGIASMAENYAGMILVSASYYGRLSQRAGLFLERLMRSAGERFVRMPVCAFVSSRTNDTKLAYEEMMQYCSEGNMYAVLSQYYGSLEEESITAGMDLFAYLVKKLNDQEAQSSYIPKRSLEYMRGR